MQYVDCCGWAIDMLAATSAAAICDLLRPGRFFRTEGEKRGGMCEIKSIRIRLATFAGHVNPWERAELSGLERLNLDFP